MENRKREEEEKAPLKTEKAPESGWKSVPRRRLIIGGSLFVGGLVLLIVAGFIVWALLSDPALLICAAISAFLVLPFPLLMGNMGGIVSQDARQKRIGYLSIAGRFILALAAIGFCALYLLLCDKSVWYILVPPGCLTMAYLVSIFVFSFQKEGG